MHHMKRKKRLPFNPLIQLVPSVMLFEVTSAPQPRKEIDIPFIWSNDFGSWMNVGQDIF